MSAKRGQGRLRRMMSESLYAAFGSYALHGFSFLISIILVRKLSVENYGVYTVLFSMYSVMTMFLSFGAQAVVQRYLPEMLALKNRRNAVLLSRVTGWIHVGAGVAIGVFCWFTREWLADFYHISTEVFVGVMPYFILFTIFRFETVILEEMLTAHRAQKYRSLMLTASQALKCGLFFFFLPHGGSIETTMFYLMVSNLVFALAMLVKVFKLHRHLPDENSDPMPKKRMLRFGLFRYTNMVALIAFFPEIDVQFITHYHGPEQAALYGFATKLVQQLVAIVPMHYLLMVLVPVYVGEYTKNKDHGQLIRVFNFYNKLVTMFLAPLLIGVLMLAPDLIAQVWDPKYLDSVTAFRIFFIGYFVLFFCNTSGFLLVVLEKPEITLYSRVFIIYNLVMNVILIPRYGIVGAAISTGSATAMGYIMSYLLIKRVIPIRIPWLATSRSFLYSGLMALAIWGLKGWISNIATLLIVVLAGMAVYGLFAWRFSVFNEEERSKLNQGIGRKIFRVSGP